MRIDIKAYCFKLVCRHKFHIIVQTKFPCIARYVAKISSPTSRALTSQNEGEHHFPTGVLSAFLTRSLRPVLICHRCCSQRHSFIGPRLVVREANPDSVDVAGITQLDPLKTSISTPRKFSGKVACARARVERLASSVPMLKLGHSLVLLSVTSGLERKVPVTEVRRLKR